MRMRVICTVAVALGLVCAMPLLGPTLAGPRHDFIFWFLRVPRVLVGAMVGATLGLVGAVFQIVFTNPLATPSTVGTTAGATLGALAVLVAGVPPFIGGFPVVVVAAFAGALAVSMLVASVAASGRADVNSVLLAGIAASLAASAIAAGLQHRADLNALFAATQWSLGHLPQVGYRGALLLAPFTLCCAVVLLSLSRGLAALTSGEEAAYGQGVDVRRLRTLALGVGSLGVAACVAWCGPIAFVGLIVPHLVRLWLGPTARVLLPMSLIVGAAFVVSCDALARLLVPDRELPVGVVTAALGAP